jgi:predicted PurR-regulated permease PerM
VLTAVLDLVPLVGSTIAGAVTALVALATNGVANAVAVIGFTLLYRLLADYLINPPVMRRTVNVSPLVTVLAVVIGGGLLGIVGALVAVPAAAAVQLLVQEVVYPGRDEEITPTANTPVP